MPNLQVKTTDAKEVWKSPDGQRVIYELTLDYQGNPVKAKTYSKDIAQVGWSGEVETYEKDGRNGSETFVKQPPKEGGFQPRSGGSGGYSKSTYAPKPTDQFTMYLSYAKDIAVALLTANKGVLDEAVYGQVLDAVAAGGKTLFDGRPDATPTSETTTEASNEDLLKNIDEVFGGEEDTPWQEPAQLPITKK